MTFDNLYIERPRYQKLLESYKGTPSVKVLQGVRRCGKSTLLDIYRKSLLDGGVEDRNVFCRKLDSLAVGLDVTAETLLDDFTRFYALADSNLPVYVFLDEIQEVDGWEKVVRKLRAQPGVDVYVTGSNADVLSRELATLLAGRCTTLDVHPLSFAEYLEFWKARRGALDSVDEAFAYYLRYGGMPGLFYVPEGEEFWRRELRGIYESVLLKDVALRCAVRDMVALDRLARYVLMMGGNLFSTRKVASALAASGLKVSPSTVDGYLDAWQRRIWCTPVCKRALRARRCSLRRGSSTRWTVALRGWLEIFGRAIPAMRSKARFIWSLCGAATALPWERCLPGRLILLRVGTMKRCTCRLARPFLQKRRMRVKLSRSKRFAILSLR